MDSPHHVAATVASSLECGGLSTPGIQREEPVPTFRHSIREARRRCPLRGRDTCPNTIDSRQHTAHRQTPHRPRSDRWEKGTWLLRHPGSTNGTILERGERQGDICIVQNLLGHHDASITMIQTRVQTRGEMQVYRAADDL